MEKFTPETLTALKVHLGTLSRRKSYLLVNAQNSHSLKEAAALSFVCDLLCPLVDGDCNE